MHTIKITPNLLFEYQCTSGKFIRLPNRIEKIDSVGRIESNRIEIFCPNWNALVSTLFHILLTADAYINDVVYQRHFEEQVEFNLVIFNDILQTVQLANLLS